MHILWPQLLQELSEQVTILGFLEKTSSKSNILFTVWGEGGINLENLEHSVSVGRRIPYTSIRTKHKLLDVWGLKKVVFTCTYLKKAGTNVEHLSFINHKWYTFDKYQRIFDRIKHQPIIGCSGQYRKDSSTARSSQRLSAVQRDCHTELQLITWEHTVSAQFLQRFRVAVWQNIYMQHNAVKWMSFSHYNDR